MAFLQSFLVGALLFIATVSLALGILFVFARRKDQTIGELLQEFNRSSGEHNRVALEDVIAQRHRSFATMDDETFRKYVQGVLNQTAFRLEPTREDPHGHLQAIHKVSGDILPVWCRAASEDIAAAEIQSFHQLLEDQAAKGGLFITSTSFTKEAKELLKKWEHIKGIDGKSLLEIFKKSVAELK